jgi:hypothetical protein
LTARSGAPDDPPEMPPLAISTVVLGVLIVGGTVFVTVGLVSVVRKLPGGWLKESQDAIAVMFSALGVLYAILLAFLVVVVWEQFNAADDLTHEESTKISNLLRDANGFPVRERKDIQRRLIVYTRAVVDWEWDTMAEGNSSEVAASAYRHVWAGYYDYHPADEQAHDWYGESISKLNELGELRRLRLISSQASIPLLMWTLLVALRLRTYFTGGGPRGNVARGALAVLRTPIPYISSVENRVPATGGVAGEDVESAKVRGPITLRTGDRAVTAEDYEQLAREAAPDLARVVCVPAPDDDPDAGAARVLIVPSVPMLNGRLRFSDLEPREALVRRIARHLDERRVIGVRIVVEPPLYRSITVVARIRARPDADRERLRRDALHALYGFFNPVEGGPEATGGWPFGRPVLVGEAYALLQGLRGVDVVEDVRLFAADPATGVRGPSVDRLDLPQFALVYSYEHRVVVEAD